MQTQRFPTYFISHGGGPWPWMKNELGDVYSALEKSLNHLPLELPSAPKAILMVSAHWEAKDFTVMTNPNPPMIYDYSGFPELTYHIKYPAPGSPTLARHVQELIQAQDLTCNADEKRGFDHGAFVPLVAIYPEANIPIVQLSLKRGLDPETHIKLGRALAPLRDEQILILGSGLSYHNLRLFGPGAKEPSRQFDSWLQEILINTNPEIRLSQVLHWEDAPSARIAHPREDHLLPLMVALGAAENEKATCVYHEENFFGGITVSSFRFG